MFISLLRRVVPFVQWHDGLSGYSSEFETEFKAVAQDLSSPSWPISICHNRRNHAELRPPYGKAVAVAVVHGGECHPQVVWVSPMAASEKTQISFKKHFGEKLDISFADSDSWPGSQD